MSFVSSQATLSADDVERFSRQMLVHGIGVDGHVALQRARVTCVGVGGLGSTAALYLVAAGVGVVTLIDGDVVETSNLHRQIAHTDARVGVRKVDSARDSCLALRPRATVHAVHARVCVDNAVALLRDADVVVDCSDNVATRYLVNDAAMRHGVPVVSGCAMRWEGQLSVYGYTPHNNNNNNNNSNNNNSNNNTDDSDDNDAMRGPCYRCLFPLPPPAAAVGSCNDDGVVGAVPGMIGCMQALETIKLLARCGDVLSGRMFLFDALRATARVVRLRARQPDCLACSAAARRARTPLRALIAARPEYAMDASACGRCSSDGGDGERCAALPDNACCSAASFAARMARCRGDGGVSCATTASSSSSLCVCVDVRAATQYAMARLPYAHSLPLSTLQSWQRGGVLWPRWCAWLRDVVARDVAQRARGDDGDATAAAVTATMTTTTSTSADDAALPRHCVVFVLCRRGIASVQATRLLLREQQQQQQQHDDDKQTVAAAALGDDAQRRADTLPFAVEFVNVTGGLQAYHTNVNRHFPLY